MTNETLACLTDVIDRQADLIERQSNAIRELLEILAMSLAAEDYEKLLAESKEFKEESENWLNQKR